MKTRFPIIWVLCLSLAIGCSKTDKEKAYLETISKDEPVQEAYTVRFVLSEKAVTKALLEAPHVQVVFKNKQEVSIFDQGVHLKFFTPEGEQQSDLTANYGEFQKEFGQAMVRGNVIVINKKGERMETEKLEWDNVRDSIYTNEFVKVYTENEIMYGDGIRAKSDFSGYKFFHIRGSIKLENGETPAIPGDPKNDSAATKPGGPQ